MSIIMSFFYLMHVVALLPSRSVTSRVGGYASLTCTVSASLGSLEDIQWTLNGTLLTDLNITGVEMIPGFFGGVLRFTGLSAEFNQTTIRCIATLQSGGILTSDTTLLLLQGQYFYYCRNCVTA